MEPACVGDGHHHRQGQDDEEGEHDIPAPKAEPEQDKGRVLGDGNAGNERGEEGVYDRDDDKIDQGILQVFIPYLQVGASLSAHYPPFVVEVAWPSIIQMYVLFGLLFLGALGALAALLMRMKIFQAIKLGETT